MVEITYMGPGAAAISNRVTRALEIAGVDPETGALPMRRLHQDHMPALGVNQRAERIQHDGKSCAALMRERAAEEAAELDAFVEMVAAHFRCLSLAADQTRIRLRGPFQELRAMARRLDAEADRRGADPTASPPVASGRDASNGRFVGRR